MRACELERGLNGVKAAEDIAPVMRDDLRDAVARKFKQA